MKHTLCLLLLCACKPAALPAVDAGVPVATARAHAHNDYEHDRPLLDALDAKFQSVEADVWFTGDDLGVSHTGAPYKGTLRELYLQPLKARVDANGGSVYGDGQPFFLWIDLKQGSMPMQDTLVAQLTEFASMLTTWDDAGLQQQRAVTVVLTGNGAKSTLVDRPAPRLYTRDGDFSVDDPPGDGTWAFTAVNYFTVMQWTGDSPIPPTQKLQLKNLIDGVHAKHRQLRVYGTPEGERYWAVSRELGMDFINTDDLSGLRAFLDATP